MDSSGKEPGRIPFVVTTPFLISIAYISVSLYISKLSLKNMSRR